MHEFSIVQALIESCESHAQSQQASAISRVKIRLGALSGVEPSLLATAFDTFKLEGMCREAVLEMEIEPLMLSCNECGFEGEANGLSVLCPCCHSPFTQVTGGEEMLLLQLELNSCEHGA
ncbi:hydrogenase maturation nickel metallochaperone HypA [Shewanella sp. JM162201]|uniref:Hydrogenase maturation factor HypA n=1 Tax=Shewanella jiangmenensis TaxID=2837387 RepID=A0ABS5V8F6_9GAMM|nr:hydrogenase maturation nickel metallochaperone HypA [Shewanella jiangmenensis]MBT1446014.1 hydrogenase maturation nickel metallochaperone HypA [Shewanella jiangmenensis]